MEKQALIEAGKEALRLALLAAVGFLLSYFGDLPETSTTMIITVVLRSVDRFIHKSEMTEANGLVPF